MSGAKYDCRGEFPTQRRAATSQFSFQRAGGGGHGESVGPGPVDKLKFRLVSPLSAVFGATENCGDVDADSSLPP